MKINVEKYEQFLKKRIRALSRISPSTQTDAQLIETIESEDKTSQATQTEEELLEAIASVDNVTQATQTGK